MPLAWKDRVQQAIAAGGTGTLTLGAASAGHQALGAADNGQTFAGVIVDGTAWETGLYTYTHAGTTLARTALYGSSTGAALNVSTSAVWFNDITAVGVAGADNGAQGVTPGGRLTLVSGDPAPTADVIGATTLYYTPYESAYIPLWDGHRWRPIEFEQVSLPGSGLTGTVPHDVFGVLSGGQLAIEFQPWTNDTTRATAIVIQGRHTKTGDKSRLYLGSVRPSGAGTFEDSYRGAHQAGGRRLVWNRYNRIIRSAGVIDTTSNWSYATATVRPSNNSTNNRVDFMLGMPTRVFAHVHGLANLTGNSGRTAKVGVGIDSTTAFTGYRQGGYALGSTNIYATIAGGFRGDVAAGYHSFYWLESGADGTSLFIGGNDANQTGIVVEVEA